MFFSFWEERGLLESPFGRLASSLHGFFGLVVQLMEEVKACDFLYLVDRDGIVTYVFRAAFVGIDKSDGFGFAAHIEQHFEEAVGHGYFDSFTIAYGLGLGFVEDGAAADVECAVVAGPGAAELFELFPSTSIERMGLGADVGHEEGLAHGIGIVAVVGGWTHVSAVVA